MHSFDSWLPPYASPCRTPVFQVPGKSQDRKVTAAMAIPTPKSTPASTRFEPPSPKAKVSLATTIATRDRSRAIALVNACGRTLTAFSQGDWPLTCANAADARAETDFFRKAFSLPASFFQMMRAGHRIGIQRPWGSSAAARRNFNFRLPTLSVPLN